MPANIIRGFATAVPGWLSHVGLRIAAGFSACLLTGAVAACWLSSRSVDAQDWWLSESGAIEWATAGMHLCVTASLIAIAFFGRWVEGAEDIPRVRLLSICALCLMLRELDCHKRWTSSDIFKTRTFVDPSIGGLEKAVAGLVIVGVMSLLVSAVVRCGPILLRRLRERSTPAMLVVTGLLLLGVGKGLDNGTRLWQKYVAALSSQNERSVGFAEEIGEWFAPLCLLAALFVTARAQRQEIEETPVTLSMVRGNPAVELPLCRAA